MSQPLYSLKVHYSYFYPVLLLLPSCAYFSKIFDSLVPMLRSHITLPVRVMGFTLPIIPTT